MSLRFAVGGVPEHFNLPWYRAAERGLFDDTELDYSWTIYPGGTGAMLAALDAGEIDLAVLLTEGVVAHIAKGGDAAILGTYVDSPLIWGIHVHQDAPFQSVDDLQGQTFGISRYHSGSHIMAFVLAEQMGWNPGTDVLLQVVRDLPGARQALQNGQADAFLWEKYTTKPVVDSGEWRRIGTCSPPWAPFVLATRRDFARTRGAEIGLLTSRIQTLIDEMLDQNEATVEEISSRFGQRSDDIRHWLTQTHWNLQLSIDTAELQRTVDTLLQVGVIQEPLLPEQLLPSAS